MIDWIMSIQEQDWLLIGIGAVLFVVTWVDARAADRAYRGGRE